MRALSEVLGEKLPYDEVSQLRDRMWEVSPSLVKLDVVEKGSSVLEAVKALRVEAARSKGEKKVGGRTGVFKKPFDNFYRTDPISRSSVTMGKCTVSFFSLPLLLLIAPSRAEIPRMRADLRSLYRPPLSRATLTSRACPSPPALRFELELQQQ